MIVARPRFVPTWVLLPLRLFLGITFTYAGYQKLADPQFFQPSAIGYIGKQIAAFAISSPLHNLLLNLIVPHAIFYGYLIAIGEIVIGLCALAGLLLRPAACAGLLLSLLFYLSATWRVYPYFYGSDIVFAFCWLTVLLNGPCNTGLPALDEWLAQRIANRHPGALRLMTLLLGIQKNESVTKTAQQRDQSTQEPQMRRTFVAGILSGISGTLMLAAVGLLIRTLAAPPTVNSQSNTLPSEPPTPLDNTPTQLSTKTATPQDAHNVIARISAVPQNSATHFTTSPTGDPGILVRLQNGQFVAFDALCTHAGCEVDYDPQARLLVCPCHGAAFDPAQKGAAVQAPASVALAPVTIRVDGTTGTITTSS